MSDENRAWVIRASAGVGSVKSVTEIDLSKDGYGLGLSIHPGIAIRKDGEFTTLRHARIEVVSSVSEKHAIGIAKMWAEHQWYNMRNMPYTVWEYPGYEVTGIVQYDNYKKCLDEDTYKKTEGIKDDC